MKRVTDIGGIPLDNSLFISSEFDVDNYLGSKSVAIDGSSIMFIQPKGSMTKEVQVYSKDSGWVSAETKDLLMADVDDLAKIITFDDLSASTYYYDHTKVPLSVTPLYEGSLWYTITLNLLKG